MPAHLTLDDLSYDRLPAAPRLRVSRTAPLLLSDSWQRVDFAGGSALDETTFPPGTVGYSAGLFSFAAGQDRNYTIQLFYAVRAVDAANVQLRLVIPSPTPIRFPFPETYGCMDLCDLAAGRLYRNKEETRVYANQVMRVYGLGVELRTSEVLSNPPTLVEATALIYSP